MAAFNSNAKTVQGQLNAIAQSSYYLERTSTRAFSNVAASANKGFGAVATIASVAAGALLAAGTAAVVLANKYNKEVAYLGAISEATSKQVQALDNAQLELSRRSTLSALQLNASSTELIKAGFAIKDVTGDTLEAVNNLVVASNGELDAARAATLASVAVTGFSANMQKAADKAAQAMGLVKAESLSAGQLVTMAADAATAAVQRSNLTFTGFADAMRQGGGAAAAFGMTIHQFAATVGVIGKTIQSGAEAGNGLRMVLTRLQNPTDEAIEKMRQYGISLYDAQGAARPWRDILVGLTSDFSDQAVATGKITQAERDRTLAILFSARASRAALALINQGVNAYDEMLAATHRLKAADLAELVLRPTANQLQMVRHNSDALAISFGKGLDPFINKVASSMLKFTQSIGLEKPRELGRIIGYTLFNAFKNTANLVQQVAIPVIIPFLRVALPVAAYNAAKVVIAAFSAMNAAVSAWLTRQAVALSTTIKGWATLAGSILLSTLSIIATLAMQGVALTAALGNWILYVSTVVSVYGGMLVSSVLQASIAIVASIMGHAAAVLAMVGAWIAARATILIQLGIYVAGLIGAMVIANGQFIFHAATAMAMGVGIAAAFLVRAAPAIITYTVMLAKATAVTVARYGMMARAAIASAIATAGAWLMTAAPAVLGAIGAMLAAIAPFMLGIAAIGAVAALLVSAWANNWGDIQGIVGKAVAWIIDKLNGFLDALSQLPLIGEHIAGARAAIGTFFSNIPSYAATAGNFISGFVNDTIAGFGAIKNITIPDMKDYSAELEALNAQLAAAEDSAKLDLPSIPAMPEVEGSEPGSYPDSEAAGREAKKAAEEFANAVEKAHEHVRDFNDDVAKETAATTKAVADLYERAYAEVAAATKKHGEDIERITKEAADRLFDMDMDRAIRDDAESRRGALERDLDDELKAREQLLENIEIGRERDLDDLQRKLEFEREMREKHLQDILDIEARARDIRREDEDRAYDRDQDKKREDAEKDQDREKDNLEVRHQQLKDSLDAEYDLLSDQLDRQIDARERALEVVLEAEERALQVSQDQREAALRAVLDKEKATWQDQRDLAKIATEEAAARAKAQAEYQAEIARGVRGTIATARLNEKLTKIGEDFGEKRKGVTENRSEEDAEAAFDAGQDTRLETLKRTFENEEVALEAAHESRKLALKAQSDELELQLEKKRTAAELALRVTLEQEKTDLHQRHEEARHTLDDRLEADALKRSRERAAEDRMFQEQQDAQMRTLKGKEDAKALVAAREAEDAERERKKKLELEAEQFRTDQSDKRRQLERTLDQEEHDRRVTQINAEKDERIKATDETLAEEQKKMREKLAQDVIDLRENLDKRIEEIRKGYIDKLEDVMRAGGEAINPLVDEITTNMIDGLNGIRDAAAEATRKLAETFDAAEALKIAEDKRGSARSSAEGKQDPPKDWHAEYNYAKNVGMSEDDARAHADNIVDRQYGGVVPGPFGKPVPIVAHGGERFEGIGAHSVALTAVRMAEAMASRGMGVPQQIQNSQSWTVNASYGRVQPEGSIARDLSALAALTRK